MPDPAFDAAKPHVSRVYDYLLGGKDNFAADRAVGDQMITSLPAIQVGVRAQRDVLGRVVRYLTGEAGVRQLLDIGSGLLDAEDPATATLQEQMRAGVGRAQFRTMARIRELFDGLELVEPGVVLVPDWRPDPGTPGVRHHPVLQMAAAGVGRKA